MYILCQVPASLQKVEDQASLSRRHISVQDSQQLICQVLEVLVVHSFHLSSNPVYFFCINVTITSCFYIFISPSDSCIELKKSEKLCNFKVTNGSAWKHELQSFFSKFVVCCILSIGLPVIQELL